jgi:hypothetical protein
LSNCDQSTNEFTTKIGESPTTVTDRTRVFPFGF